MNPVRTTSRRPRRVLLICGGLSPTGGVARQMAVLADRLKRAGIGVRVLIARPIDRPNPNLARIRRAGVPVHCLGGWARRACQGVEKAFGWADRAEAAHRRPLSIRLWKRCLNAIERHFGRAVETIVTAWRPQIVHVFMPEDLAARAILAVRRRGVPVVFVETGEAMPELPHYPDELLQAARHADVIIALCERVCRNARRLYGAGTNVRTLSPLLPSMKPIPSRRHDGVARLCYAGRISPEKNLDGLLDSLAKSNGALTPWRLTVAGDGSDMDACVARVQRTGLAGRVHFTGAYNVDRDFAAIASQTDLFVVPSHTEGFGFIFLEIAASGRPVVAAPVGAAPEIVRDGRTGFLAEGSDVEALSSALARAFKHRAEWPAMGEQARRLYESTYRPERIFEDTLAMYAGLLDRGAGVCKGGW